MTEYHDLQLTDDSLITVEKREQNNSANRPFLKLFRTPKSNRASFGGQRSSLLKKISFGSSSKAQPNNKIKKYDLLSQDNLNIPIRSKSGRYFREIDTRQPLIGIGNSDSDEYEGAALFNTSSNHELKSQLIKDGYNLDEQSDTDDLDLLPPRPFRHDRCLCCSLTTLGCIII